MFDLTARGLETKTSRASRSVFQLYANESVKRKSGRGKISRKFQTKKHEQKKIFRNANSTKMAELLIKASLPLI